MPRITEQSKRTCWKEIVVLTLHSEPRNFSLEIPPGRNQASFRCTFAIPTGTWTAGWWEVVGHIPSGVRFARKSVCSDVIDKGESGAERYRLSGVAGAETL